MEISKPDDITETLALHEAAFRALNLAAFRRVIAVVVQPGVEFGHTDIIRYASASAAAVKTRCPQTIVYEAHSTDYQTTEALTNLVHDGFTIPKVGPGLTFALREALYALDLIAAELHHLPGPRLAHDDGGADAGRSLRLALLITAPKPTNT